MVQATVALRVDVDTRRGLAEGVPRLLELFRRAGVRASFFVTLGPDRSGLAIRRALRPSFLYKMWRTNPLKLYGLRTLLSGTLLPALPVGAGAPALLRQIADEGHEVAPHGDEAASGGDDRPHDLVAGAEEALGGQRDPAPGAPVRRAQFELVKSTRVSASGSILSSRAATS